jgi:hypothetical protein
MTQEIKVGTILNFRWYDGLFGKAIRYYNRLIYHEDGFTHSSIVIEIKDGFYSVAEALGNGFIISDYEDWWVQLKIREKYITVGNAKKDLEGLKA